MKKQTILFSSLIVIFLSTTFMIYPSGSPGGYTGSPADVHNCNSCHNGTTTNVSDWISSTIPAQGYVPGQTYQISVTGTGSGNKGFELTAENASDSKTGSFTAGSGSKLTNNNHAVTHTTDVSANPHTWTFSWTAPQAGTGTVNFYAAVVVGKPNVNLTSLQVSENTSSDITDLNESDFKIKPNPAKNFILLKSHYLNGKNFKIYSISGSLIYNGKFTENRTQIDISDLKTGSYLLMIETEKGTITKKFIKN
jgi:hypothetical protein